MDSQSSHKVFSLFQTIPSAFYLSVNVFTKIQQNYLNKEKFKSKNALKCIKKEILSKEPTCGLKGLLGVRYGSE